MKRPLALLGAVLLLGRLAFAAEFRSLPSNPTPRVSAQSPSVPQTGIPQAGGLPSVPNLPEGIPGLSQIPGVPQIPGQTQLPAGQVPLGSEGNREILDQLAPERSGELTGEQAKDLSGRLIDPREGRKAELSSPVDGSGSGLSGGSGLAPSDGSRQAPQGPPEVPQPRPGLKQRLGDSFHYWRLYMQNLHWYTVIHIRGLWPSYRAKIIAAESAGAALPVSRRREFFAEMRVMGQTGYFSVLGFDAREDGSVIREARRGFRLYFTRPGVGLTERSAFEAFIQRANGYNADRRAHTNMRKQIRDAMLAASVKPVAEVAPFFDGLLKNDVAKETADFQGEPQRKVLEGFRRAVNDTVLEEDPAAPDRVRGAILLGSFALGAATPRSDFDLQVITANGGHRKVAGFKERLMSRWVASGGHAKNPVSIQDFPYVASKNLIRRVHVSYLILSPSAELVSSLERKPGELPAFSTSHELTPFGRVLRVVQLLTVYATSLWSDLRGFFIGE